MSEIVLGTPASLQDTLKPQDASKHLFADDLISYTFYQVYNKNVLLLIITKSCFICHPFQIILKGLNCYLYVQTS